MGPVRAHRHLERQLAQRPAGPGGGMDRLRTARRAVHAGDQARRRRFPVHGVLGTRLRVGLPRGRPVERRGRREPGGDRGRARGFGDPGRRTGARLLAATCGGVRVHSVYVPNGREVGSEHYEAKLAWLGELRAYLVRTCKPTDPVAVCGDFNVAPEDRDVWDPAALVGATHVTVPERQLCGSSRSGAWSTPSVCYAQDQLFTWWDYRAGNFHKHMGMRIDLLCSAGPWPSVSPTRSSTATPARASSRRTMLRCSSTSRCTAGHPGRRQPACGSRSRSNAMRPASWRASGRTGRRACRLACCKAARRGEGSQRHARPPARRVRAHEHHSSSSARVSAT